MFKGVGFIKEAKRQLIQEAMEKYRKVYPCGSYQSFEECFTVHKDRLVLWFDTEDHSTHAVQCHINA